MADKGKASQIDGRIVTASTCARDRERQPLTGPPESSATTEPLQTPIAQVEGCRSAEGGTQSSVPRFRITGGGFPVTPEGTGGTAPEASRSFQSAELDMEFDESERQYAFPDDFLQYAEEDEHEADTKTQTRAKTVVYKKGANGRFQGSVGVSGSSSIPRGTQVDNSWRLQGPSPGGPIDPSVIPSFGGHIARTLWSEPGRALTLLKTYHRPRFLRELTHFDLRPELVTAVQESGLMHLRACVLPHLDIPLITAFVERWQPDTNTFHMPFGEMTIMLHDVARILGLPIEGESCLVRNEAGGLADKMAAVGNFFGRSNTQLMQPMEGAGAPIYRGGGVQAKAVHEVTRLGTRDQSVQGYLITLLGEFLFVDKSSDRIRPSVFPLTNNLDLVPGFAWGAGTLAYLYRQLGMATREGCAGVAGCLTLLQVWIYEYFADFRPGATLPILSTSPRATAWVGVGKPATHESKLLVYRRALDRLTADRVTWEPFVRNAHTAHRTTAFVGTLRFMEIVEPYQADRVLRQLGYVQTIPEVMPRPTREHRPRHGGGVYNVSFGTGYDDHHWRSFRICRVDPRSISRPMDYPGEVAQDYLAWYTRVSHPRIIPPSPAEAQEHATLAGGSQQVAVSLMQRFAAAEHFQDDPEARLAYFDQLSESFHPVLPHPGECPPRPLGKQGRR